MCKILNARVAEIAMEYEVSINGTFISDGIGVYGGATCQDLPHYSTDHNAAFEMLRCVGYYCTITCGKYFWEVRFAGQSFMLTDQELPKALCLAVLQVKGDKEWVDKYIEEDDL